MNLRSLRLERNARFFLSRWKRPRRKPPDLPWGSLVHSFEKKEAARDAISDVADDGFLSDIIHISSRNFVDQSTKSPNGRYTLAWSDGGPDQSRRGCYFLLDYNRIIVEGSMPRPNDGRVIDSGVFILNDWGSMNALSGTFAAFNPDGSVRCGRGSAPGQASNYRCRFLFLF